MSTPTPVLPQQVHRQRRHLLRQVSRLLEMPMTVLSFVWLALMIVEFTAGLNPMLEGINYLIWMLFIAQFALEFWIAPEKLVYLREHWLTAFALLLPALRSLAIFRAFRLFRTVPVGRGVRLVRWLTSLNRGMRATQRSLKQRGMRYVIALTLLVDFAGAAGIYYFENPAALRESGDLPPDSASTGLRSYGESLWWTSMMLTTMGSDYFPRSAEGRLIGLLLAIYGFAIFGYITATVASLIIRVDQGPQAQGALHDQLTALQREIAELRISLARPRAGEH